MSDKDQVIDKLWERSNHGTQREDIVAAYEAGAASVAADRDKYKAFAEEFARRLVEAGLIQDLSRQVPGDVVVVSGFTYPSHTKPDGGPKTA